jgi:phytoene dehydrogenase-like protein
MSNRVVVVGGGLAGLTCARALHAAGIPILLLEATDRIGGRVKTDLVDGFRLDHGYQVLFTGYPNADKELDLAALDLKRFRPGATVYWNGGLHVIDRARRWVTFRSQLLGLGDKRRLGRWAGSMAGASVASIRAMGDMSTHEYFDALGFSRELRERFLQPFFTASLLDPTLEVSRRQTAFVWKMASEGFAALPALGMEEIPKQLASDIPNYLIRRHARVEEVVKEGERVVGVRLDTGEFYEGAAVVLATDSHTAAQLSGQPTVEGALGTTTVYFEAAVPPVEDAYIVLNGTGKGSILQVVPITNASPDYAPAGKHLVAVSLLGVPDVRDQELAENLKAELGTWFPSKSPYLWRFIRAYRIPFAQFPQPAGVYRRLPKNETHTPNLFFAGEFTTNSSIDGAMQSGFRCAERVAENLRQPVTV